MTTKETEIETPAGEPVIRVRRFFKAPPELVYKACTEADYIRRWMGPRHLEVSECQVDQRVGGTWRLVHRAPDGAEFVFYGELLELDPPRRRVGTFVWEGAPEDEAVETMELEAVEGGTLLTTTMVHSSVAARDMHVANGMEGGVVESYERLDEVVAEEQAAA
jgi:uncharacterized protein YndB with AHSA1/START domain